MKIWVCFFFLITFYTANVESHMIHQHTIENHAWTEENLNPFNELMLTWNADRPLEGRFLFYISVKTDAWSPWLLYASWGHEGQSSFNALADQFPAKTFQDAIEVTDGTRATAFRIKVSTEGSAHLNQIHGLHVYLNSDKTKELIQHDCLLSIDLDIPGLSQMTVAHPRFADLCSPTSTTAVTRYLSEDFTIDPVHFAEQAWDAGFDLFGNWVFNVAQASTHLGAGWDCWVTRLNGFNELYTYLEKKTPVIVSVRGPLQGSAQPYARGHLLVVKGFDSASQRVLCMDPAFQSDHETHVSYNLLDFIQAWDRRGNVAYVFQKK